MSLTKVPTLPPIEEVNTTVYPEGPTLPGDFGELTLPDSDGPTLRGDWNDETTEMDTDSNVTDPPPVWAKLPYRYWPHND